MEQIWLAIKTHPLYAAIGAAGLGGILLYAFLHKSSSSSSGQQDLLVAPNNGSGPSPVTGTTQTMSGGTGSDVPTYSISAISPVSPVAPFPATSVNSSDGVSPVSPISPGGLVTPNPVAPVSPFPAPASVAIPNPPQTAPLSPAIATQVFNVGIPPNVTNEQSPQAVKALTAAATPNYVGTPLGPGTPVITGQPSAAATARVTQTSGGQTIKQQAAASVKAGGGALVASTKPIVAGKTGYTG